MVMPASNQEAECPSPYVVILCVHWFDGRGSCSLYW